MENWRIVDLPKICDPRGNLTFVENHSQLPFAIGAVEWIYDIPSGTDLAGNAFYSTMQLVVALSGSFDVALDDGRHVETVRLSSPEKALMIDPMVWRELLNFSSNSVALVLESASDPASDRMTNYETFKSIKT